MRALFIAVLIMVAVPSWAYEYDSTVDPVIFSTEYTVIKFVPKDNIRGMLILKSEMYPKYALNFVVRLGNGRVMIVSYGYIENDVLKHYILYGNRYIENHLPPNIRKAFRTIIEGVMNGTEKKETGQESYPTPGSYQQENRQDC